MKILVYSANFAPEPTGIGKYSGEMCAWLASRGHNVRAISAPPYYPNWKIESGYRRTGYLRESWSGVDIWRAPIWVPKKPNGITRVLHLLSFAITSFPLMLRHVFWAPDVVIAVAPAFVCAPTALLTARLCGARAWLHMQDFEIDLAFQMKLLRGSLLQQVIRRMERWVLRRFDVVSSISRRMVERLFIKGVEQDRICYFPNWVDISLISPTKSSSAYRTHLGIPTDAVVALFSGTLGGKQGLRVIPEAARMLAGRKDIVFVICGDGMMKSQLESMSADLLNVRLIPLQPFERLGELLCIADIHLLPQSTGAADLVLPSKLSGMLASGRPVIATCDLGTELHSIVHQCGVAVPPHDAQALANAVCKLAESVPTRLDLGRRARAYAEQHFEREKILSRIFATLEGGQAVEPDDAIA
jgi:colanic acid biosynthesis glycosyl transferase WcaI